MRSFHDHNRSGQAERSEASRCPSSQTLSAAKGGKRFPILVVNVHDRVLMAVELGHPDAMMNFK
ncbi:MAG TPA: hypothetical protein VGT44_16495 [Ktedonobacteraceae bacterium]|nr:hypothetical protein [Ktedonobacteraceae bacterium]